LIYNILHTYLLLSLFIACAIIETELVTISQRTILQSSVTNYSYVNNTNQLIKTALQSYILTNVTTKSLKTGLLFDSTTRPSTTVKRKGTLN
jgi:hypothetical protein